MKKNKTSKQLYRSSDDKILAGVAGGIGEFLEIDSTLVRIIFALLTIFGGSGILIYLVLWLLIPTQIDQHKSTEEILKKNAKELKKEAKKVAADIKNMAREEHKVHTKKSKRRPHGLGIILITVGTALVLSNYGFLRIKDILPLILIVVGLLIVFK